jgi:hypothetical protein
LAIPSTSVSSANEPSETRKKKALVRDKLIDAHNPKDMYPKERPIDSDNEVSWWLDGDDNVEEAVILEPAFQSNEPMESHIYSREEMEEYSGTMQALPETTTTEKSFRDIIRSAIALRNHLKKLGQLL